jgi:hypothetical protein
MTRSISVFMYRARAWRLALLTVIHFLVEDSTDAEMHAPLYDFSELEPRRGPLASGCRRPRPTPRAGDAQTTLAARQRSGPSLT